MHNINFRTVEDENTKQKKDISISKKFEKKKKSDLKTENFSSIIPCQLMKNFESS